MTIMEKLWAAADRREQAHGEIRRDRLAVEQHSVDKQVETPPVYQLGILGLSLVKELCAETRVQHQRQLQRCRRRAGVELELDGRQTAGQQLLRENVLRTDGNSPCFIVVAKV